MGSMKLTFDKAKALEVDDYESFTVSNGTAQLDPLVTDLLAAGAILRDGQTTDCIAVFPCDDTTSGGEDGIVVGFREQDVIVGAHFVAVSNLVDAFDEREGFDVLCEVVDGILLAATDAFERHAARFVAKAAA